MTKETLRMEVSSLIELVTSIISLSAAVIVLLAVKDWQLKWQREVDLLDFIYRSALTPEEFKAFEEQISIARKTAKGNFGSFKRSLRSRIDHRKVRP